MYIEISRNAQHPPRKCAAPWFQFSVPRRPIRSGAPCPGQPAERLASAGMSPNLGKGDQKYLEKSLGFLEQNLVDGDKNCRKTGEKLAKI